MSLVLEVDHFRDLDLEWSALDHCGWMGMKGSTRDQLLNSSLWGELYNRCLPGTSRFFLCR